MAIEVLLLSASTIGALAHVLSHPRRVIAAVPLVFGAAAMVAAAAAYAVFLVDADLGEFFSVGAQIIVGVLLVIALEIRKGGTDDEMEAALQIVGVLTVLFGAVSALVGLLVGP